MIVIALHEFVQRNMFEVLAARFTSSHKMTIYDEQPFPPPSTGSRNGSSAT